ncbi:MAG: DNA ligase [Cocleimonas sp.]|nr:DNA ligase [Cocleimonas sp.]
MVVYCLFLWAISANAKTIPELLLAETYKKSIDVSQYLVSEKLDGVRAYWDGKQLISRQGNRFNAPHWFIKDFPNIALDGELWIARGRFQQTVSTVRKKQPIDKEWRKISYQLFELPQAKGTFQQRVQAMQQLVQELAIPHLNVIKQYRLKTTDELSKKLDSIVAQGAEGLMLHRSDELYLTGRHHALLKVKQYQDAEARVIEHLTGKGKFSDMLGSMIVEDLNGLRFKIGTGFNLQQRKNPPKIGSMITYKYFGRTQKGRPRFASFLRVKQHPQQAYKKMKLDSKIIETSEHISKTVIWLHGLGADGHDFVPLIPELKLPNEAGIRFIFPHAPVRPVTLNKGYEMRAWYDLLSLEPGKTANEADVLTSVAWISALIDQEIAKGIAAENILLVGFSQGGVIALQTGLRYPQKLAGIMALSTYFPFAEKTLAEINKTQLGLPIFAAHGINDPVIPLLSWQTYVPELKQAGFTVEAHSYPMEHSLCSQEITDMSNWLKIILKTQFSSDGFSDK